jgi:hypothetical protein
MALAEATHHDGITGTSTPLVVLNYEQNIKCISFTPIQLFDYMWDIINGMSKAAIAAQEGLKQLINTDSTSSFTWGTDSLLAITSGQVCHFFFYNCDITSE